MVRLTLELDPDGTPIRGWLIREGDHARVPFTGLLELVAALDAARASATAS